MDEINQAVHALVPNIKASAKECCTMCIYKCKSLGREVWELVVWVGQASAHQGGRLGEAKALCSILIIFHS